MSSTASTAIANEKKKDEDWEYGKARDPTNRNAVWCKLCNKKCTAGISRLKEHLIGGYPNVTKCPNVPVEVSKKFKDMIDKVKNDKKEKKRLEEEKRKRAQDVDEESGEEEDCSGGGITSRQVCNKRGKVKGPLDCIYELTNKGQRKIENNFEKKCCAKAISAIAAWFYDNGIAFNTARSESFQRMIHAIGTYGADLRAPIYHELRVPLLKQAVTKMQTFIGTFRVHWKTYGCTIMSDWWTDKKGRTLINFLVNCLKGTVFLRSIDGSAHVHDVELIRGMFDFVIQEVGPENVVQIVTDNASNYVKAAVMLEKDYPTLYWSLCTAHCLDLILEDIGELKEIKDVVRDGKAISVFVYNHLHVLSLMRRFTNKRDLVRPGVTRFATNFLSLESLFGLKTQLRAMFNSEEWSNSKWSKRIEGRKVARIVSRTSFWKKVEHACKIMAPLVDVVRLVDREERPCMGYIYEAMDKAKEIIRKNLGEMKGRL